MSSYEHREIARTIDQLEISQITEGQASSWLRAERHLDLLRTNGQSNEVILFACSRTTFIHAVITKAEEVIPPDYDDLLKWNSSPYTNRAVYSWHLGGNDVKLELEAANRQPNTMQSAQNLIFGLQLEGLD